MATKEKKTARGYINDGLQSLTAGLGDPRRDKLAATKFVDRKIADKELKAAFDTNWIARRIVTLPPEQATRKWRTWRGDKSEDMVAAEKALQLKSKVY